MADWGDPWGSSWSVNESSAVSGPGAYSGFVQPNAGKKRKKIERLNKELESLVNDAIEELGSKPKSGDVVEVKAAFETEAREIGASEATITQKWNAIKRVCRIDLDDEEAIALLLVA